MFSYSYLKVQLYIIYSRTHIIHDIHKLHKKPLIVVFSLTCALHLKVYRELQHRCYKLRESKTWSIWRATFAGRAPCNSEVPPALLFLTASSVAGAGRAGDGCGARRQPASSLWWLSSFSWWNPGFDCFLRSFLYLIQDIETSDVFFSHACRGHFSLQRPPGSWFFSGMRSPSRQAFYVTFECHFCRTWCSVFHFHFPGLTVNWN